MDPFIGQYMDPIEIPTQPNNLPIHIPISINLPKNLNINCPKQNPTTFVSNTSGERKE